MSSNDRLFDLRTVERNIRKGKTTLEDYQKYLDSLEDASENSEEVLTTLEGVEHEAEMNLLRAQNPSLALEDEEDEFDDEEYDLEDELDEEDEEEDDDESSAPRKKMELPTRKNIARQKALAAQQATEEDEDDEDDEVEDEDAEELNSLENEEIYDEDDLDDDDYDDEEE